ncbi:MAG: hypothetical protein SFW36_04445 [Leptolyngbyaceae cyanobacterium bins.59]|nr:hypothetical protein [Leptolyngbyaceae cyanobacterium bins.59]
MKVLGASRFDQCVVNLSLVHLCNQESHVGQELRKTYSAWKEELDETAMNPWFEPHWFTIYVPHPDQQYEEITLEEGLTRGYNIEVKPIHNPSQLPYQIPEGGHFVVVLKQKELDGEFTIAATGIFIRPLGVLSLDILVDPDKGEYQPMLIRHPVIRDYPEGWEQKLHLFMERSLRGEDLPGIVGYVDQAINQDYRPPSWNEMYLSTSGFAGF